MVPWTRILHAHVPPTWQAACTASSKQLFEACIVSPCSGAATSLHLALPLRHSSAGDRYAFYSQYNVTGTPPHLLALCAVGLGCLRKTMSLVLVLLISTGSGATVSNHESVLHKANPATHAGLGGLSGTVRMGCTHMHEATLPPSNRPANGIAPAHRAAGVLFLHQPSRSAHHAAGVHCQAGSWHAITQASDRPASYAC